MERFFIGWSLIIIALAHLEETKMTDKFKKQDGMTIAA